MITYLPYHAINSLRPDYWALNRMSDTNVIVQLVNKMQFDLFGAFIQGNNILLAYSYNIRFIYGCKLNDFQIVVSKTQYKAIITEVDW